MTDALVGQVEAALFDGAHWSARYDKGDTTTARAVDVDDLAPRIAACMRAVKESTRLNAWIPEDEAEPLIAAAGLAALRGET